MFRAYGGIHKSFKVPFPSELFFFFKLHISEKNHQLKPGKYCYIAQCLEARQNYFSPLPLVTNTGNDNKGIRQWVVNSLSRLHKPFHGYRIVNRKNKTNNTPFLHSLQGNQKKMGSKFTLLWAGRTKVQLYSSMHGLLVT